MTSDSLQRILENGDVPGHLAIIMDGNGRWAQQRGLPRHAGHREGMKSVREAVEGAIQVGIGTLTLFAFSTENWNRPAREISALMALSDAVAACGDGSVYPALDAPATAERVLMAVRRVEGRV